MSPYRSEAQRKKFRALLEEGKISPSVVSEFDKASRGLKLPERVNPKGPKKIASIKVIKRLGNK